MTDDGIPRIERLTTGIPTLDDILDGGFPAGSLNIIAGGPGTGKTILALQLLFHQARLRKKNVYFTSIAEPAVKFLRYVQQFEFFDPNLVNDTLFVRDLSKPALQQGLEKTVETLKRQIEEMGPAIIAVDSFKALRGRLQDQGDVHALLYGLVVSLAVSDVTAFLVGEYDGYDITHLPESFAADSILNLSTDIVGLRASRQLEVLKLRGSRYAAGRHFFDISSAGITAYPRVSVPPEQGARPGAARRLSTGVPGLDDMLGGGIPTRTSTVLEGGSGTGKTILALSFLVEGARQGEPGLMFTMDETREQLFEMAAGRNWELHQLTRQGLLEVVYTSPLDLVGDAVLQKAKDLVGRLGAKRVVIDSLTALNLSIAAEGRAQELVYSLVKTFRAMGVTVILTAETPQLLGTVELTAHGLSAVADNIVLLRYVEIQSRLAHAITVLKVRGSSHQRVLRELQITGESVEILGEFHQYQGVLTGVPTTEGSRPGRRRRGRRQTPQP